MGGLSNFVFFPWAGFVFAGAIVGLVLDGLTDAVGRSTWRTSGSHSSGLRLTMAAYELSFFPTWYPQSHFWTTSPAFFFLRVGIMTAAIGLAYAWDLRPGGATNGVLSSNSAGRRSSSTGFTSRWSTASCRGRCTSACRGSSSWVALALFCLFMLWCSIYKDRVVARDGEAQGSGLRAQARVRRVAGYIQGSCLSPEP